MDSATISELIKKASTGDDQAFAGLIHQHRSLVFGAVWAILQDFDDADDATQETFVMAYRHLEDLKDPQKFTFWLTTIARNVARKTARKRTLKARGLEHYKDSIDIFHKEAPQTIVNPQTLKRAIQTLTPADRIVTI